MWKRRIKKGNPSFVELPHVGKHMLESFFIHGCNVLYFFQHPVPYVFCKAWNVKRHRSTRDLAAKILSQSGCNIDECLAGKVSFKKYLKQTER